MSVPGDSPTVMTRCQFIPPYLIDRLASYAGSDALARTRVVDEALRASRATTPAAGATASADPGAPAWTVSTAGHTATLPGIPVRAAGEPPSDDQAVDEAAEGVQASLALFREVYGRDSYDDRGAPVLATVHYEQDYDNAFWDGTQLVFGDGDGTVFERFTKPVDVLGHEFTHAVTEQTAALAYQGQSGALNESVSDVFASCLKQRLLGQRAEQADWLIGEGIFLPSVQGRALRSMAAPGTAYDDPRLGVDPQVGSMVDYVETQQDNGGVHINSGIPNRAFQLAATALGGDVWEVTGPIWYAALTSGIGADTDFAGYAAATLVAAEAVSSAARTAVEDAWREVGVLPAVSASPAGAGEGDSGPFGDASGGAGGPDPGAVVAVTRSGGFAGLRHTAELRLGDDPRTPEVEHLLARIDVRTFRAHQPQPDRYVYAFSVRGEELVLGEHELTPELQQLARLLLDQDR